MKVKLPKNTFAPGGFGCHEAMHVASILADLVNRELINHLAIARRDEWIALASKAEEALLDLYHAIGSEHLS
jgi:hypothetical protein